MLKVHGILDSTIEIATSYEKHCRKLKDSCIDYFIFAQMDIIMVQLRNHKRSMSMLLGQSESISKLVSEYHFFMHLTYQFHQVVSNFAIQKRGEYAGDE